MSQLMSLSPTSELPPPPTTEPADEPRGFSEGGSIPDKRVQQQVDNWNRMSKFLHSEDVETGQPDQREFYGAENAEQAEDEEEETEEDMKEEERRIFMDEEAQCCLLCRRRFKYARTLRHHFHESDLHKGNVAVHRKEKRQKTGLEGELPLYRDRAAERRDLYGQPEHPRYLTKGGGESKRGRGGRH